MTKMVKLGYEDRVPWTHKPLKLACANFSILAMQ